MQHDPLWTVMLRLPHDFAQPCFGFLEAPAIAGSGSVGSTALARLHLKQPSSRYDWIVLSGICVQENFPRFHYPNVTIPLQNCITFPVSTSYFRANSSLPSPPIR